MLTLRQFPQSNEPRESKTLEQICDEVNEWARNVVTE